MKFLIPTLFFAATIMAQESQIAFPVPHKMTLNQAQAQCGNDAKVSCCKKATYTHDITSANSGPLAGVLQSALSGGPGGDGLGLFGQCKDLSKDSPVLNVVGPGLNTPVDQECKENIACCQNSPSRADGDDVAVPCVALGSLI